ncbi:MAG: TonB-dependent receptor [Bacteroidota bacterium]
MKYPLLAICLLFLLTPCFAQQPRDTTAIRKDTIALREVVILSSYRASDDMPVSFKNLDIQAIEQKNIGQEPSFILSQTPSISVYSDAGSYFGYSYFRLRGMDQTRVNLTLNGVPLNEPEDQGAYFSNYPDFFNSIQSLQIQRGVGTSTNGVASYAGSINLESASLFRAKRELYAGYGSFNTHRVYAEYATGLVKKQGLYLRASSLHSDGYKEHSGNTSQSIFYSYGFFGKKHLLKVTGFVGNQRNQMAWIGAPLDSLRKNQRYNANSSDEKDHFVQSLTQVQHTLTLGSDATLNTCVYYNFLQGNYDFDLNNFLGFPSTSDMYNYAFRSHFTGLFSNYSLQRNRWKLNAGVHGNLYQRRHTGSERTLQNPLWAQLYQNTGHKNEASAFVKASYTLGKAMFFGDLQYRYANFEYQGSVPLPSLNYAFFNPHVGLRYQLNKTLSAYYSIGKTGREPTRNDLFNGSDDLPADSLGLPVYVNLSPESVVDQELGVKWQFSRGHLFANVYYMGFDNEIVLNGKFGPNGLPLHSHVASSSRGGLEIDFQYDLSGGWRLVNNASFSRNRITEDEAAFNHVLSPSVMINQEIQYHWKKLFLGTGLRYQSQSFIDYANQIILPAFYTVDFSAAYQFKHLELSLKVNNLTNQRYYTNGAIGVNGDPLYFTQAATNYFAGVKYQF